MRKWENYRGLGKVTTVCMKDYKAWRKGRLQSCTWKALSITQLKTLSLWEDKKKKINKNNKKMGLTVWTWKTDQGNTFTSYEWDNFLFFHPKMWCLGFHKLFHELKFSCYFPKSIAKANLFCSLLWRKDDERHPMKSNENCQGFSIFFVCWLQGT